MDEEKRRGRPRKKEAVLPNEEVDKIAMAQQSGNGNKLITTDDIRLRWHDIFRNYSSLGFDTIYQKWGQNSSFLSNPFLQNQRVKQILSNGRKLAKDELREAMSDPEHSEESLRSVSMGLYYTNFIYQTLVQLNRHTPKYNYYATPLYVKDDKSSKKTLEDDSVMVDKILKKFNPPLTLKTIATQVYAEGKCSYLVRTSYNNKDVDFLLLQKLNSDMVKITGFGSKQQFIVSFNMAIFLEPAYSVEQYPEFIRKTWEDMMNLGIIIEDKRGRRKINPKAEIPLDHILENNGTTYMYWVKLPQDLCYTFYSDGAHPNAFPDAIGLFTDLNDLDDYRWLQGNLLSKGINSILTAEVPIVKDPKAGSDATVISPDTILGYSDYFMTNVSANIFPFFAPFVEFDLHTLENQPESMDIIYSRIRDLIATSGNSALLPITDKPSIASVKAAEALQASKNDYLTKQFENFLNNVINENYNLKHVWRVVLHSDIFYWRDDSKMVKELVLQGATGLLPRLLSFYDQTLEDYKGSTIYLDALDIRFDDGDYEEKNPVGRPKLEDDEIINDNTGISNDMGNNVSEIK